MKINHALWQRISKRWVHRDLTQLTIKKDILGIKLRDITMANRSHNKTSGNNGHWSHGSKRPMLLMKTMCHKTHLVASEPSKRVLTLWTHLQVMGPPKGGIKHYSMCCALRGIMLPLLMKNNTTVGSWLKKNNNQTILFNMSTWTRTSSEAICRKRRLIRKRCPTRSSQLIKRRWRIGRRRHTRRRRCNARRWHIMSIWNLSPTSVMKRK
jgi:hypothetical protein